MDVNVCTFTGRLTRDAEFKTLPTGTDLVVFDIANNTGFGSNEKVLYLTVNLWGKSGTNLLKYLVKGKSVAVYGQLETQRWISKDGIDKQKNVLNSSSVTFMGTTQQSQQSQQSQQPQQTQDSVKNEDDDTLF